MRGRPQALLLVLVTGCGDTQVNIFPTRTGGAPKPIAPVSVPAVDAGTGGVEMPPVVVVVTPPQMIDSGAPDIPVLEPPVPDSGSPDSGGAENPRLPVDAGPMLPPEPLGPCGNSRSDPGEHCDDGNEISGDGCSSECEQEPGYLCGAPPGTDRSINGDFADRTSLNFATDYNLLGDDEEPISEGTCSMRPHPDASPVLHKNFKSKLNTPWADVDPDPNNRSLLCNAATGKKAWTQQLQLDVGEFTVGFWVRSWGVVSPPKLQLFFNQLPVFAPVDSRDGSWIRRTASITVSSAGLQEFELSAIQVKGSGSDFALDRIEIYPAQADACFPLPSDVDRP